MVINLNRCVACYACVAKCKQEHFLPKGIIWNKLLISETGKYSNVKKHVYPVLCNHCQEPACVKVCPTGATQQREDGIVWIDQNKCMGCKHCMIACPYQVRVYYSEEKEYFPGQGLTEWEELGKKLYPIRIRTVSKCNFCKERIDKALENGLKPGLDPDATPACVIICPSKARIFGDLDDYDSEVSKIVRGKKAVQLYPVYGTNPSVYYIGGVEEAPIVTKYFGFRVFDTSPELIFKKGSIEPGAEEK